MSSPGQQAEMMVEEINLKLLVEEVGQVLARRTDIRLCVTTEVLGCEPFYSDPFHLKMILYLLMENAIYFAEGAHDETRLSVEVWVRQGMATLAIADNGAGLDESELDQLFDPLYEAPVRRAASGAGMYMVRRAVSCLHGSISVVSEAGAGTLFMLRVPNSA